MKEDPLNLTASLRRAKGVFAVALENMVPLDNTWLYTDVQRAIAFEQVGPFVASFLAMVWASNCCSSRHDWVLQARPSYMQVIVVDWELSLVGPWLHQTECSCYSEPEGEA